MSIRNSALALTLVVALACFGDSVAHAAHEAVSLPELDAEAGQCRAFIMTSRPGGDANVAYGAVYRSLEEARQDALSRCSLTNLAEEGWGPCRTWCVPAEVQKTR
jgi:hypothetical protein